MCMKAVQEKLNPFSVCTSMKISTFNKEGTLSLLLLCPGHPLAAFLWSDQSLMVRLLISLMMTPHLPTVA